MESEIEIDDRPTGVKMSSKISLDLNTLFQFVVGAGVIGGLAMILNINSNMGVVNYKLDQLAIAGGTYATKEQLEVIRNLASEALPRAEAAQMAKLRDLQQSAVEIKINQVLSELSALKQTTVK